MVRLPVRELIDVLKDEFGHDKILTKLENAKDLGFIRVSLNKVVAINRNIDRKSLIYRYNFLKDPGKREEVFDHDRVELYEYKGKYYVENGNHRVAALIDFKDYFKVDTIMAQVYRIL